MLTIKIPNKYLINRQDGKDAEIDVESIDEIRRAFTPNQTVINYNVNNTWTTLAINLPLSKIIDILAGKI